MHNDVGAALSRIFEGIEMLQGCCVDGRKFTIDGRLVGDVGEMIAAREFDIILDERSRRDHDARVRGDNRDVQIKATFKNSLTFTREPALYLGLKLCRAGGYEVVFNGPGSILTAAFAHRKHIGEKQLSFPVARLRQLAQQVPEADRVPVKPRSLRA